MTTRMSYNAKGNTLTEREHVFFSDLLQDKNVTLSSPMHVEVRNWVKFSDCNNEAFSEAFRTSA